MTCCNSSGKHIPHMLYWIQVRLVCWPFHTGDIVRLKAFVCNVCTVRTGVIIHKQKFSTHGVPKQTYMFQNDIPIDVACHRYTLNMQVSSGTKNNSSPKRAILYHRTVSFNGVLYVVTYTWRSSYENPARIRLQTKRGLVGKRHTRPLLRYPQCMLSTPG